LLRRYIFSTDHKVIGLQYGFTSLFFLLVGFGLVMLIRWQQAFPAQAVPLVGAWLGESNAPGGVLLPEFYNQLGAMHGTIMVFLGVVPLAFGAFGNYVVPLQIGAPDMAFPRRGPPARSTSRRRTRRCPTQASRRPRTGEGGGNAGRACGDQGSTAGT
jgi:cytochrome c oxidase subunit 1